MAELTIRWRDVPLSDVVDYFAKGFKQEGARITGHEYFVDPAKGRVIFKLYVEEK